MPGNIDELPQGKAIVLIANTIRSCISMSSVIDFKCDFDDKGRCRGNRIARWSRGHNFHNKMCCCTHCYESMGYLSDAPPISETYLPTYEKLFKREIGFWRRGKGCSLPRYLRSVVCSFYTCNDEEKHRAQVSEMRQNCTRAVRELKTLICEERRTYENNKSIRFFNSTWW